MQTQLTFTILAALACAAGALDSGARAAATDTGVATPEAAANSAARSAALPMNAADNPFHRPLQLESGEDAHSVRGDARGIIAYAFAPAAEALSKPDHWCDVLSLHLNTKYCRPSTEGTSTTLHVSIGSKAQQPLADAHRVNFVYRVVTHTPEHLQVTLTAAEGPMGTSDYRILLDATPADGGRSLVRLSYAYSFGMVGKLALQAYLGTIAREKVGFTVIGKEPDGGPRYIGGARGLAERNTMRYYLAIESFLGALAAAPQERTEKSMQAWFDAVERFPRQLHEMGRTEYLEMKRREYARQRAPS